MLHRSEINVCAVQRQRELVAQNVQGWKRGHIDDKEACLTFGKAERCGIGHGGERGRGSRVVPTNSSNARGPPRPPRGRQLDDINGHMLPFAREICWQARAAPGKLQELRAVRGLHSSSTCQNHWISGADPSAAVPL